MPNQNVVNPGTVNVADQGDGLLSVDQPVTVSPPSNAGPIVQAGSEGFGLGTDAPDQPVTVTPPMTAQATVQGGAFSPVSPDTENVITNDVVQQVYGVGTPKNVFV